MTGFWNFLKGPGNTHIELGRLLWALATLALIAYEGVAIWFNHQNFSAVEFGGGAAAILAAGGFGIAAKDTGVAKATAATGDGQ